jgi:hypothetical protein
MKLFAYSTRSARAAEPNTALTSKRALAHQFRLLNEKNQVKFLGTAFFRSDKKDKSDTDFSKDARLPLTEFGMSYECTQIQYKHNDEWKTLN